MKHQIETTSSSHCLICSHVSYVLLVYIHSIGPHELVAIARDIFIYVLKHIRKKSNFNISKIKDDQQQPLRGVASAFSPKLSCMKSKANATSCFSADRKLMIILPTFSIYFSYELYVFYYLSTFPPGVCVISITHLRSRVDTFGDRLTKSLSIFEEDRQFPRLECRVCDKSENT